VSGGIAGEQCSGLLLGGRRPSRASAMRSTLYTGGTAPLTTTATPSIGMPSHSTSEYLRVEG